jgi:4-amino-4-deoxy-L-arabinose transferase-like glycosyltransferase
MDRLQHKTAIIYILTFIVLLAGAGYNVFYHLEAFPIYSWDEARHGVSAYEMLKKGNFIVNTYRGHTDYWNLKPPLSFWAIMAGYKLVGYNALGLRFSSAIFSLLTIIMVAFFVFKKYGKLASILTTLVLSTCTQYLINHSSRTGDADSLYVFLFSIAILSLMQFNQNKKWLYVSGLAFAFAFLTKSWHSGNIVMIIGLYLLLTGQYKRLSLKNWLLLLLSMILPILVWGAFRYQYDGLEFFKGMIMYDLLQRSGTSIEGHVGGILYYLGILLRFFRYWLFILCFLVVSGLFKKDFQFKKLITSEKKDAMIGIILWALIPFLIFTIAKTKIRWYILPIYPALSIILGVLSSKFLVNGKRVPKVLLAASILFVSVHYEQEIYTYLNKPVPNIKQSLIEKVTEKAAMKGESLYIYHLSGKATWLQSEALTAELSDNLQVKNGDFKAFLKKPKALLLVPEKLFSEQLISSNQLKIIAFNHWGYLLDKRS